MRFSDVIFPLSLTVATVSAGVTGGMNRRAAFTLKNGQEAQALNRQFQTLTASSSCTTGETACVGGKLAQCVGGTFSISPCAATLQCVALPLVNKPGTRYACRWRCVRRERKAETLMWYSVTCDTLQDAQARIAATGATGGLEGRAVEQRYADLVLFGVPVLTNKHVQ